MSHVLAWICVVLVASMSAYGLQLTAAAMVPSAAAAEPVTSTTSSRKVLIVAVDPVTGDREQVECDAPSYSFASDLLLVEGNEYPADTHVCTAFTEAVRP